MSDTWKDIQALQSKRNSYKEKLLKRKRERDLVLGIADENHVELENISPQRAENVVKPTQDSSIDKEAADIESALLSCLYNAVVEEKLDSRILTKSLSKTLEKAVNQTAVELVLKKFGAQELIRIKEETSSVGSSWLSVEYCDHAKLMELIRLSVDQPSAEESSTTKKTRVEVSPTVERTPVSGDNELRPLSAGGVLDSVQSLLNTQSTKERESKKVNEEVLYLLSKPTAKEQLLVEKFKSQGGVVQEFCPHGTKDECMHATGESKGCGRLHFRKIIKQHTDESLGDCSFLNTCFHMDTCKYVHYEINDTDTKSEEKNKDLALPRVKSATTLYPPQWIQSDLRVFDMTVLGKFSVVMADPPWDIHMELPYGTMKDNEMMELNIPCLQDEGFFFLWVTGRAMELGRECLKKWGYDRCDELIWVKTNQLQRIIRTGRTGHWLNHGKEHCLVGFKGSAGNGEGQYVFNRGLDCDVIVSEVRETSHKPDEVYGIIERLSPGTRKLELFGRPHNIQPNWITLGNQVDGVRLIDPDVVRRFKEVYPDGNALAKPQKSLAKK